MRSKTGVQKPALAAPLFLAASGYVALIILAVYGVQLITDEPFWRTVTGWILLATAALGLFSTVMLVATRDLKGKIQYLGEISFLVWLLLLGCALPLAAAHSSLVWRDSAMALLVTLSLGGLALVSFRELMQKRIALWQYSLFLLAVTPLVLAWANTN